MGRRREKADAAWHEEKLRNRITLLHSNLGWWERNQGLSQEHRDAVCGGINDELDGLGAELLRHREKWPVQKRSAR